MERQRTIRGEAWFSEVLHEFCEISGVRSEEEIGRVWCVWTYSCRAAKAAPPGCCSCSGRCMNRSMPCTARSPAQVQASLRPRPLRAYECCAWQRGDGEDQHHQQHEQPQRCHRPRQPVLACSGQQATTIKIMIGIMVQRIMHTQQHQRRTEVQVGVRPSGDRPAAAPVAFQPRQQSDASASQSASP